MNKKMSDNSGGLQADSKGRLATDNNGRLEWVDVLKCLAMLLVVIGHATLGGTPDKYRFYIYAFHMPMFFIISGMTFYLQLNRKPMDFIEVLKNKTKTLVIPYFILSFLTVPIWILNFRILTYKDESIKELIFAIFYSHQHQHSGPSNAMWFCLTLFLALLSFYLLNLWSKGDDRILSLLVLVIGSFGYTMSLRQDDFYEPWHIETVPIVLMCLLAGWMFIKHLDVINKILGSWRRQILWVLFLFPSAFFCARVNVKISMAVNTYGSFLLFAYGVIGFSLICFIICKHIPPFKILNFIGRNTIVILAFHAPIFRFLQRVSDFTNNFYNDYPIIVAVIVFIALIPVCYIFERFLPFLIGRKRKKKI